MKRNTKEKIFAILALIWILVWVVSTWLLYLFSPKQVVAPTLKDVNLSDDQIEQLRELTWQKNNSWEIIWTWELSNSWNVEKTLTWAQENIQSWTISLTWITE